MERPTNSLEWLWLKVKRFALAVVWTPIALHQQLGWPFTISLMVLVAGLVALLWRTSSRSASRRHWRDLAGMTGAAKDLRLVLEAKGCGRYRIGSGRGYLDVLVPGRFFAMAEEVCREVRRDHRYRGKIEVRVGVLPWWRGRLVKRGRW